MNDADTVLYVEVQYLDGRKESYGANVVVESDYCLILTRTSPEPHELRIPMRNIAWYGCTKDRQDITQAADKPAPSTKKKGEEEPARSTKTSEQPGQIWSVTIKDSQIPPRDDRAWHDLRQDAATAMRRLGLTVWYWEHRDTGRKIEGDREPA